MVGGAGSIQWHVTWAAIVTGIPTLQFIQSDIDSIGDVRESRACKLCQPPSVQLSSVSQSCLTLCNPMECSTPGSSVHGIFQARILDWVVISYSGDLPDQGVEPTSLTSPTLGGGFLTTMPPGKLQIHLQLFTNTLQLYGLQQARLPCPSPTPKAYSNSCPQSWWCHPTISSSVIPFYSHLQTFPASGFYPMSQFFTSGGQSIGVSASATVLPMNIQDWFPLGWTGWISLESKGLSRVFYNTTVQKHEFFSSQLSL